LLLGVVAIAVVVGALTAAFLVFAPFHHKNAVAQQTSPPVTAQPSSAAASPSSVPAPQQAAESLAGLLQKSVADRSAIAQAVSDVNQCGPNLNQDPSVFEAAATSRQNLLAQLANLPDRSALSPAMLAVLTSAWQNSIKADQDFAEWARDEISQGCTPDDQSDPGAEAAVGPDGQATTSKESFVRLWDPVAAQYGLPSYQWNQL
jgi:hypothetical protein